MIEQLEKYIPFLSQHNTWIVQVFIIVFAALLLDFFQKKLLKRLQRELNKTTTLWDDALVYAIIKPLSVMIWLLGITIAMHIAGISSALKVFHVGVIVLVSWTLIRLISKLIVPRQMR